MSIEPLSIQWQRHTYVLKPQEKPRLDHAPSIAKTTWAIDVEWMSGPARH
jgi:hypothetical protein